MKAPLVTGSIRGASDDAVTLCGSAGGGPISVVMAHTDSAWWRRVDGWLTPALLAADPRQLTQARLAVLVGATSAAFGPIFTLMYAAIGMNAAASVVAVAAGYLMTAPLVLRWTGSTVWVGHQAASALWGVIVGLAALTGGLDSPATPWLGGVLLVGLFTGGWRVRFTWLVVSLLTFLALAAGETAGAPFGELDPTLAYWLRLSSLIGSTLFTGLLVVVARLEHDVMRRHLQQQVAHATEADRAKSMFLANMSHELRTPLNAILGYTDLVDEELADLGVDDARADLGRVRRSGRHLLALIDDLLDLSRIEVGALQLRTGPHDLRAVCAEVVAALGPLADAAGTTLHTDLAPAPASCDRVRVAQIMTNLAHNAIKFGRGQPVTLRTAVVGGRAVAEVIDSGPGLTAEELGRVFDEFQQAHPSIRAQHGGTGLGLTISRRLARAMGGELTGASTPGAGATFRLELPAA